MWVQGSGVALTPSSLSSHTCPALRGCDKKRGKTSHSRGAVRGERSEPILEESKEYEGLYLITCFLAGVKLGVN